MIQNIRCVRGFKLLMETRKGPLRLLRKWTGIGAIDETLVVLFLPLLSLGFQNRRLFANFSLTSVLFANKLWQWKLPKFC
ncbi:hypothetical protein QVD17_30952 [Tagetes erecta]|uniref:Uncharacterized protein n=1 Tax=Tagetes erecta TaxID=13708 RepID=A0AAD8K8V0_TARER|nr:hypothetical protein QVD17_30952 [Tagetes erecta]